MSIKTAPGRIRVSLPQTSTEAGGAVRPANSVQMVKLDAKRASGKAIDLFSLLKKSALCARKQHYERDYSLVSRCVCNAVILIYLLQDSGYGCANSLSP